MSVSYCAHSVTVADYISIDTNKVAEVELVYKTKQKSASRPKISSSNEAYKIIRAHWNEDTIELYEQCKVLLLNRNHRVLGIFQLSAGGQSTTVVDPGMIAIAALKANACTIILAHNHPSGSTRPSPGDISITKKVKEGCALLDIVVLDHLIVTLYGFHSMADSGDM